MSIKQQVIDAVNQRKSFNLQIDGRTIHHSPSEDNSSYAVSFETYTRFVRIDKIIWDLETTDEDKFTKLEIIDESSLQ